MPARGKATQPQASDEETSRQLPEQMVGPCRDSLLTKKGIHGTDGPNEEKPRTVAIAANLEDGNISEAARILCFDESSATVDEGTIKLLHQNIRHPHRTNRHPPPGDSITLTDHRGGGTICSFPMGSSGSPDGLRPNISRS